ncbi:A/G-specific adenine glycosylase [Thermanaeromonas sp. C210]|uniref:A/G-specific adenine glycosylase n=1 Tax=Thermanaeromonas sp. C210 TaxID=2731925 RepID=UPI00155CBD66|nr:A/G-specific adenine glycosylase [Thermanaeromonas sp. C210]GFN21940.1 hypothetical protein TAMC210_02560 [Thermanaeromonas sp. C210]
MTCEAERLAALVSAAAARLAASGPFGEPPPWRTEADPYAVFVAEFLLVRTRADVVARVWEELLRRYPSFEALAAADEGELAALVAPLGLRKRVPLLKRAAAHVVERYGGRLPEESGELQKIPGMGPYTAAAVSAFAFGRPVVPADVNVLRFLSRLTGLPSGHPTKGSPTLRSLVARLGPAEGGPEPGRLIDFTRHVCRPRRPRCGECPLGDLCGSALLAG